jgi:hypothetical protein
VTASWSETLETRKDPSPELNPSVHSPGDCFRYWIYELKDDGFARVHRARTQSRETHQHIVRGSFRFDHDYILANYRSPSKLRQEIAGEIHTHDLAISHCT